MAAVLLVHHTVDAQLSGLLGSGPKAPNPYKSHCGTTEQSYLFNQCLQDFGVKQLSALFAMSRANRCLVDRINCGLAGQAARCINGLLWPMPPTKSTFTNTCKAGIKETLSYLLMEYRFNCGYQNIECKCWRSIPDISPAAARGQARTIPPQGCPPGSG